MLAALKFTQYTVLRQALRHVATLKVDNACQTISE